MVLTFSYFKHLHKMDFIVSAVKNFLTKRYQHSFFSFLTHKTDSRRAAGRQILQHKTYNRSFYDLFDNSLRECILKVGFLFVLFRFWVTRIYIFTSHLYRIWMFDNVVFSILKSNLDKKRVIMRNVYNICWTESPKEVHAVFYGNT